MVWRPLCAPPTVARTPPGDGTRSFVQETRPASRYDRGSRSAPVSAYSTQGIPMSSPRAWIAALSLSLLQKHSVYFALGHFCMTDEAFRILAKYLNLDFFLVDCLYLECPEYWRR